jgi:branched-chain amino acid transport system substrate-binding protein
MMHQLKPRFRRDLGVGAPALALAGLLAAAPAAAQDVKIGALMSMTGDLQAYGESCLTGINLAIEQINAAGGLLDGEATVSVGDDQTAPQPGIAAAQKLVSVEGVAGLIGGLSSGITIPVAQSVTTQAGVPQISPASTSPAITDLKDDDFLFRTVPSDAFQGEALAQITRAAGYGTLAVFYVNNDYGEGLARSFQKAFEAQGGKVNASLPFEGNKASYRGELAQLAEGEPEGLVLISYPESGIVILRQALEEGFFSKFVFTDGMKAPEIIDAIGAEYLNGSIGTAPQALTDTDAFQRYREAYEERFGELPPKPFIDTSYDATMVLALAIEKAGSTEGRAIRDALREVANPPGETILPGEWEKAKALLREGQDIAYVGASGSVNLDDQGDVGGSFAHWTIEDGEIKTIDVFEMGA